jgi:RNA polymerase sigma-70 factor (ECF subfamily)
MSSDRNHRLTFLSGDAGDRALRARLLAGEDEAYRECYAQHAPRLMRLLARLLGELAVAEEVLQESFLAAFRSLPSLTGELNIAGWLTRIATNRAYNAIRERTRRHHNLPPSADISAPSIDQQVESRDLIHKVLGLLDEMDPDKKLALLLQAEGYSVGEIADVCGEPRGTILSRLSRARTELLERMAAAGLTQHEAPWRLVGLS